MFVYTTAIKKLRRLKSRKKVVQGGTSAGKTFGILPVLIDRAIKTPGLEISVVSETVPHLRRGAIKDFIKIMQLTNRLIESNWNKSLLKYTFSNGSYIEFFSADQESKLRGARRNVLYVNEANNISFEAYYQLAIRTSGEIWLDFNPTLEFWAHTEVATDSDAELIILNYKDNEALDENIVNEIEKAKEKAKTSAYWRNWWNVYGLGKIGNLQGVVFSNWEQVSEIPDNAKLLGYGMDFGYTNDPTTCVAVYQMDGAFYYDEILYSAGLTNADIYDSIIDVVYNTMIYADSAEPKSIEELRRLGLNIEGAEKGKDSIMFGINKMQQSKFYVTENSTNLVNELRGYVWQTDKTGRKVNKPIDSYNHLIDAIRYFLTSVGKYDGNYR